MIARFPPYWCFVGALRRSAEAAHGNRMRLFWRESTVVKNRNNGWNQSRVVQHWRLIRLCPPSCPGGPVRAMALGRKGARSRSGRGCGGSRSMKRAAHRACGEEFYKHRGRSTADLAMDVRNGERGRHTLDEAKAIIN